MGTRPRSRALKLDPYTPQFQTRAACTDVFKDLPEQDQQSICNALTAADENIGRLVEAINDYATALLAERETANKKLKDALEKARDEKDTTGSVSADTQEEVRDTAVEATATDARVIQLEKQVAAYQKLPGVIGNYNKYFAQLVATLKGARSTEQASKPAPQSAGMAAAIQPESDPEQNVGVEDVDKDPDLEDSILEEFVTIYNQALPPEEKITEFTKVVDNLETNLDKYEPDEQPTAQALITGLRGWIDMFGQIYSDFGNVYVRLPALTADTQNDYEMANQALRQQWLENVEVSLSKEVDSFKPLMEYYVQQMSDITQANVEKTIEALPKDVEIPLDPRVLSRKEKRERIVKGKRTAYPPTNTG